MNNHYFIKLFQRRLSEFTGAPYVVLTDSCSNALFLCLMHYRKTNVVSIPKHTYVSVAQSCIHAGYHLQFRDEEWVGSYQLEGTPIRDCAVGFEKKMYEEDTMMCISFQQKKSLPIGKGGAILLDNKDDYETLRRLAWDGRDASVPVKDDKGIILGYHMNMTPDDAAKGTLLLNNYNEEKFGSYLDYPDISEYFRK